MSTIPLRSYGVIVSDPATIFDLRSENGNSKSAQSQYNTESTPAICEMMRGLLEWCCAPDSVHVMWCTAPHLARGDCHQIMRASGFTPKTMGAWRKLTKHGKRQFGLGYIWRSEMEFYMLGTRGEPRTRNKTTRNGIIAKVGRHSEKPERLQTDLEKLFWGPYLEINARRTTRPNWDFYGDEIGGFVDGGSLADLRTFKIRARRNGKAGNP